MHQTRIDAQVLAQIELEQYIEEQANKIAPEYEIDAILDIDFGTLYRVWLDCKLLGTFYRAVGDGKWVAQPCCVCVRYRLDTAKQAQQKIISVSGLSLRNAA
ncbi:MAG: hypothetical protein KME64_01525 [Scytonematopsis contorta HA4267-MV1]|jgi:hypothetical protein|nr:hypothetical protein [Scytonematopsis contorta HA4267-MV1]